ncbi:nitrogen fixation protein NifQ [Geoalkalibacter halelectricus]|nr:nitrogen fixation protein NifQ [Geoalkalibacter halelectricus]
MAMSEYTETIRRWAADTRRAGTLAEAQGVGEVGLGGDEAGSRLAARFFLRIHDDHIADLRYQVFGCGFSMAACAAAAELALLRSTTQARDLGTDDIETLLGGLPPERGYCAELAVAALHAALDAAREHVGRVEKTLKPEDHQEEPRVDPDHPLYRSLMNRPCPPGIDARDRHLFACLLCVAVAETRQPAAALGLPDGAIADLLQTLFACKDLDWLADHAPLASQPVPRMAEELLPFLLAQVPTEGDAVQRRLAGYLARIIAARAAYPGHLWVAMGLFERPQLTAAITRLLPSLAAANHQGMRWKRFLYKQLCEQQGGRLCKAPACGLCSDYALCFASPG